MNENVFKSCVVTVLLLCCYCDVPEAFYNKSPTYSGNSFKRFLCKLKAVYL